MKKINIAVIVIVIWAIFVSRDADALRPPLASEAISSARQNAHDL